MKKSFNILKEFYGADSYSETGAALFEDLFMSLFLQSGSGLLSSIVRGWMGHFFIKSKLPLLIGRRVKLIRQSHMTFGKYTRIKDDVEIIAHGRIIFGDNVCVSEKSTIWSHHNMLHIGNYVTIGRYCYLSQLGGSIRIGNNVLIGDHVKMYTQNHIAGDKKLPTYFRGFVETDIDIGDDVFIGSGVTIFNNVKIGKGSIVGANSIVNKDVPPGSIVGGIPAKFIKKTK